MRGKRVFRWESVCSDGKVRVLRGKVCVLKGKVCVLKGKVCALRGKCVF